ncbi:hypothetical protein B0T19DRAFT_442582 [Cercophora scortea]|uniref:Uncharacterized protein n=1 Tax=Cercophora scortea TaxID=314031 RepID=A0AAE0INZ2_9PEZI|nr:hypothetical protein B0T19DRAFT_442582 [Cercophora scortea]
MMQEMGDAARRAQLVEGTTKLVCEALEKHGELAISEAYLCFRVDLTMWRKLVGADATFPFEMMRGQQVAGNDWRYSGLMKVGAEFKARDRDAVAGYREALVAKGIKVHPGLDVWGYQKTVGEGMGSNQERLGQLWATLYKDMPAVFDGFGFFEVPVLPQHEELVVGKPAKRVRRGLAVGVDVVLKQLEPSAAVKWKLCVVVKDDAKWNEGVLSQFVRVWHLVEEWWANAAEGMEGRPLTLDEGFALQQGSRLALLSELEG